MGSAWAFGKNAHSTESFQAVFVDKDYFGSRLTPQCVTGYAIPQHRRVDARFDASPPISRRIDIDPFPGSGDTRCAQQCVAVVVADHLAS